MIKDDETVDAANVYLGMLGQGTFTNNAHVKKHLTKILKEWLLMAEQSPHELWDLEVIYDSLTRVERKVWQILGSDRVVNFDNIRNAYDGDVTDHAIERTLKNIRSKLNPKKWLFSISRSKQQVRWIIQAGKKID